MTNELPAIRLRRLRPACRPKWITLAVACTAGAAMLAVVPVQSAGASGGGDGCNPGRSNNSTRYSDGAVSGNVGVVPGGVYASIMNYSPFVAGPNQGASTQDDVSEWVMLDHQPNQEYVQIGWVEFPGGIRYTFDEVDATGGGFTDQYFPSYAINSTHQYKVTYDPNNTSNHYSVYVDGVLYSQLADATAPNDAQIFAETHTAASQIPGGKDNEAQVSEATVYPNAGPGNGWANFDGITEESTGSQLTGPSWAGEYPAPGNAGVNNWTTWDNACTN